MEDGDGDAFPVQGFEQILQGWPVKLQFHPDRGRFLTATRRIEPGEVILRERAWAFGSSPVHKAHICHACLTFSSVPLKLACPKCSQVYFCSKHCWQSAHLGQQDHNNKLHHREECDALLRLHRSRTLRDFDDDEIEQMRLAIQILVNRFHELKANTEEMECSDAEKDGKQEEQINVKNSMAGGREKVIRASLANFLDLMSNRNSFMAPQLKQIRRRAIAVLSAFINSEKKKSDVIKGFKIDTMVDYFARAESNTFARYHFTKRKTINYGSCMYLCAAMCNHSCFPSAARDWSGQDLKLRALYPIEEGEEVTITYVPLRDGARDRQRDLFVHYHFNCSCPRCEDVSGRIEDHMTRILFCANSKKECDGLMMCEEEEEKNERKEDQTTERSVVEKGQMKRQLCFVCGFSRLIDAQTAFDLSTFIKK